MIKSLFAILILFVLGSCQNEKPQMEVGLIVDLTGPMSLYGSWVYNGAQIAIDELKSEDIDISLITEDSKSEPKSAVNSLQKIISTNNIQYIISGNGSSSVMAMAPIANKNERILFVTLASSPSISTAGQFIFRNRVSGVFEAEELAQYILSIGAKKVGVIAINNEAGLPYSKALESGIKNKGGQIVITELINPEESNYKTQILKLKNLNPDAVFVVLQSEQAANFFKQSKELNFSTRWFGISSLKTDKILSTLDELNEDIVITSEGSDTTSKEFLSFSSKYAKRFGEKPSIYAINGYDAVMLYFQLVKNSYNSGLELKKGLEKIRYIGAGGSLKFDKNGDVIKEVKLFHINEGAFVLVNPNN